MVSAITTYGQTHRDVPFSATYHPYVAGGDSVFGPRGIFDIIGLGDNMEGFPENPRPGDITYEDGHWYGYNNDSLWILLDTEAGGGSGSFSFNGNRAVKRVPGVGDNTGTSTISEWLEWWYWAPPSITLSATGATMAEIGSKVTITLSGLTTYDPGTDSLFAGAIEETFQEDGTIYEFDTNPSYTHSFYFQPMEDPEGETPWSKQKYQFQAHQSYTGGLESGSCVSPVRTITGIYPYFYGVSANDYTSASGKTIYEAAGITKVIEGQGDKTVSLTGSGYIYFIVPDDDPSDWSALRNVFNNNGYNVTEGFTGYPITVSSDGLENDYTDVNYILYVSSTESTYSSTEYTFDF